jgi:hypothetical protein
MPMEWSKIVNRQSDVANLLYLILLKGWMMANRRIWPAFGVPALMLLLYSAAWGKTDFFRVEDVRPGMKGVGKTCFRGTTPEEFQVEILGVLRGIDPGATAVLARFSGNVLEKTGIFEGMSGSPVFIDGKLLGAVAFSFSFTKEAIGGITPITQMVDAVNETIDPFAGAKVKLNRGPQWNYRLPISASGKKLAELEMTPGDAGRQPVLAALGGHSLIPIATPLSLGGFHKETIKAFESQFRSLGMSILKGAGSAGTETVVQSNRDAENTQLEAGSNIVVSLIRGDLDVSAGGTVTYVDGNRLYAFGHSMFELGFTELPMHKARAVMVVPSLESSFKILEIGDQAGTIRQDRGRGIYGIIGEQPRMVPLHIRLTTSRGTRREFKFELARDPLLTPLLVNLAVYNTILTSERAEGFATLQVKGKINVKNEQPIEVDNRFSSDNQAPNDASLSIAVPVNYLMMGGYSNLDLQNIELEISARETDQSAVLESIRLDRTEVKAGESLDLEISYTKANGEVIQDTYPIKIPANASPGPLTMLVADGTSLMALDEKEEGVNLIPRDLTQLIKFVNNLRKNDQLYVRFFRQEPGAVVKGEGLPGLPPSILTILKSQRKVGAITSIQTSTLMEYEMPRTEYLASGMKILKLMVKP